MVLDGFCYSWGGFGGSRLAVVLMDAVFLKASEGKLFSGGGGGGLLVRVDLTGAIFKAFIQVEFTRLDEVRLSAQ